MTEYVLSTKGFIPACTLLTQEQSSKHSAEATAISGGGRITSAHDPRLSVSPTLGTTALERLLQAVLSASC